MTGLITKYSEPVPFHKTMGTRKLVIMERDDASGERVSKMNFEKIVRDDQPSILMFAKMAIDGRPTGGLEKHHFVDAIQKRADAIYPAGLSPQQRFAKALMEDEVGQTLYQAVKAAPGNEIKAPPQEAPQDFMKRTAETTGPAHAKLHSLAVDAHRADPKMTYAQAYSAIYAAPENAELRASAKNEHLAQAMRDVPRALR